jgi:GT2 family glycosyltransferase
VTSFQRVQLQDGGGNQLPAPRLTVRRWAALGDSLCASVVADRLCELGFTVDWQTHGSIVPLMRRVPSISGVEAQQSHCDVNLDRSYEQFDGTPKRQSVHFHQAFFDHAAAQLRQKGIDLGRPLNCRPRLTVTEAERALAIQTLSKYEKPWTFICPGSLYFRTRQVPNHIWEATAKQIVGTKLWLGLWDGPPGIVDLKVRQIDHLLSLLAVADLLITPDTGPLHMAAALGVQVLAINQSSSPENHLSDLCDYETIGLGLSCENCCLNICPKDQFNPPCQQQHPDAIASEANRKLRRNIVSCVIPTFNAPAERLNRCLDAVLNQVDEIVVTADAGGKFPKGARQHPKIRYVQSRRANLGFGRTVNYGVRHSSGDHVWVINDDFFAQSNVAPRLKSIVNNGIGMATHLIRYEGTGRIYYASKPRGPTGFYHADHNQFNPSREGTFEVENACGCSFMLNRKAFYASKCFDEEFGKFYCEDDALAMQLRSNGWKLMYTTDVFGNHIGSASTSTLPDKDRIMHESNVLFGKKWANRYIEHNRNNSGLGNFTYLRDNT